MKPWKNVNPKKILDISLTLSNSTINFPSDPKVEIKRIVDNGIRISKISLCTHSGTHVDAPFHFIKGGNSIDKVPLSTLVGSSIVLDFSDVDEIDKKALKAKYSRYNFDEKIVLFKTRNSILYESGKFTEDYVYLTEDGAEFLVEKKIKAVGIDYLSIEKLGNFKEGIVHKILLSERIPIIEGLYLRNVEEGEYFFVCLPIKIKDGDGAPARAVLIQL